MLSAICFPGNVLHLYIVLNTEVVAYPRRMRWANLWRYMNLLILSLFSSKYLLERKWKTCFQLCCRVYISIIILSVKAWLLNLSLVLEEIAVHSYLFSITFLNQSLAFEPVFSLGWNCSILRSIWEYYIMIAKPSKCWIAISLVYKVIVSLNFEIWNIFIFKKPGDCSLLTVIYHNPTFLCETHNLDYIIIFSRSMFYHLSRQYLYESTTKS